MADSALFEPWLKRWALVPDGAAIITPGSRLLPVRQGDTPAMLKLADDAEEKYGNLLMTWWEGEGAASVLAHHKDGLLMERAWIVVAFCNGCWLLPDCPPHGFWRMTCRNRPQGS